LSDENKGQTEEINRILSVNHPLVETLREYLDIPYNFYIEGTDDLNHLLIARGFKKDEPDPWEDETDSFFWLKDTRRKLITLKISKKLFDEEKRLKFIKKTDWNNDYVDLREEEKAVDDDLPF